MNIGGFRVCGRIQGVWADSGCVGGFRVCVWIQGVWVDSGYVDGFRVCVWIQGVWVDSGCVCGFRACGWIQGVWADSGYVGGFRVCRRRWHTPLGLNFFTSCSFLTNLGQMIGWWHPNGICTSRLGNRGFPLCITIPELSALMQTVQIKVFPVFLLSHLNFQGFPQNTAYLQDVTNSKVWFQCWELWQLRGGGPWFSETFFAFIKAMFTLSVFQRVIQTV